MDKSFVTESPEELTGKAEKDIVTAELLLAQKFHPEDYMYDIICFHATQAIEKLLKSYIIINGKDIEKTHDLSYLCKSAEDINTSFVNIKNHCVLTNDFVPGIKYGDGVSITKQNISEIIKALNTICNFPPIKAMRDSCKNSRR